MEAIAIKTTRKGYKARRDAAIIEAMRGERPCTACGSHPCPPGSAYKCSKSTDEAPNSPVVIRPAMALFVERYGNPYEPKAATV